jgi:LysM repeat protein
MALPVFAQAGSVAAVNTGKLNVRSGPGIIFAIITKLDYNTVVTLIGRADQGTWVQIRLANGTTGWVNSIHLRTYADLSLLPITYVTPATPPPAQTVPPPGGSPPGGSQTTYIVRAGDDLKSIAARYGTTWQILAAVNGIINPNLIYPGQRLIIAYSMPTVPSNPPPTSGGTTYVVQSGDTLQTIAARYGTTWQAIAAANNLSNPNQIQAGMRLTIPSTPAQPRYYTVQRGDTLYRIALNYGVTVQAIMTANNLSSANLIYAGQRLLIP